MTIRILYFELIALLCSFLTLNTYCFQRPLVKLNAGTTLRASSTTASSPPYTVAILGASGYTGAELMRLLAQHPFVQVNVLTADRSAGLSFSTIFPQFSYTKKLPMLTKWEDSRKEIEACDIVFCCLPHGTTQEIISILATESAAKIIDLSADFRLSSTADYEKVLFKYVCMCVLRQQLLISKYYQQLSASVYMSCIRYVMTSGMASPTLLQFCRKRPCMLSPR